MMDNFAFQFFHHFSQFVVTFRLPLFIGFVWVIIVKLKYLKAYERIDTILMFIYFFLIISSFWVLKPIKKSMLVGFYNENPLTLWGWHFDGGQCELLAKELNLGIAIIAALLFSLLSRHYQRQKLTFWVSGFFIIGFCVFNFLFHNEYSLTVWAYYLFGDLYITLMVATFFAFLNDCEEPLDARKLYGLIGLGGVAGGFFGSSIVAGAKSQITALQSTWIVMVVIVIIVMIAALVGQRMANRLPSSIKETHSLIPRNKIQQAFSGLKLITHSKYFMSIIAIVMLYEMISTILDFQFTQTITHYVPGKYLGQYFAMVFTFTNFLSLVVQLFITGFVLTRYGVGVALLFLPLAILLGSFSFLCVPVLIFGSLLNTMDNSFSYSINQSAKETLYTTESSRDKYNAKAFIDIFILRFAKAMAVILSLVFTLIFSHYSDIKWLSLVVIVLLVIWFIAIRYASKQYAIKEKAIHNASNLRE